MKHSLIALTIGLVLVPSLAFAQTTSPTNQELLAQIASLQAQVDQILLLLKQIQESKPVQASSTPSAIPAPWTVPTQPWTQVDPESGTTYTNTPDPKRPGCWNTFERRTMPPSVSRSFSCGG